MNAEHAHLSGETSLNSALLSGLTCERNDAAKTNCPTVLENLHNSMQSAPPRMVYTRRKNAPSQERIVREVANEHAVDELHNARKHEEDEERVNEFKPVGRVVVVRLPQRVERVDGGCAVRRRGFWGHRRGWVYGIDAGNATWLSAAAARKPQTNTTKLRPKYRRVSVRKKC